MWRDKYITLKKYMTLFNMGFKTKTLIIFDWDDTLFPTTWVTNNNIMSIKLDHKTKIYFENLDNIISKILDIVNEKIIIVTNASTSWVIKCIDLFLPKTKKIIKKINIYSSRDSYQDTYPTDNFMWKKLFFEDIVTKMYNKRNFIPNIISIGDAEYEYLALINLYATDNKKIIKAIKLLRYPNKDDLFSELNVLYKLLPSYIYIPQNLDIYIGN